MANKDTLLAILERPGCSDNLKKTVNDLLGAGGVAPSRPEVELAEDELTNRVYDWLLRGVDLIDDMHCNSEITEQGGVVTEADLCHVKPQIIFKFKVVGLGIKDMHYDLGDQGEFRHEPMTYFEMSDEQRKVKYQEFIWIPYFDVELPEKSFALVHTFEGVDGWECWDYPTILTEHEAAIVNHRLEHLKFYR